MHVCMQEFIGLLYRCPDYLSLKEDQIPNTTICVVEFIGDLFLLWAWHHHHPRESLRLGDRVYL